MFSNHVRLHFSATIERGVSGKIAQAAYCDAFALTQPGLPQAHPRMSSNGRASDNCGQARDIEELAYDSIPPKRTVIVSVRYLVKGRGQPLPSSLDEGVDE